ncbi:MAG: thioredoxin [Eubacteriales bacterium]
MATIKISKDNFQKEVVESNVPVLVDFWAQWCGPCKMIGPILEEISEEVSNVKIGKVNVEEEGEIAVKFRIMNIPTLILFVNGEPVETVVGAQSKADLLKLINS